MSALPSLNDTTFYKSYSYLIILGDKEPIPSLTDEQFFNQAASVVFPVNQSTLPKSNAMLGELAQSVIPQLNRDSLKLVKLVFRGTASPEGSTRQNALLGQRRVQALYDYVTQRMTFHMADSLFKIDNSVEDYASLCLLMRRAADPDYAQVQDLYDSYAHNPATLKAKLRAVRHGQLWQRLHADYFPQLRTARFVMILRKAGVPEPEETGEPAITLTPAETAAPIASAEPVAIIAPTEPIVTVAPAEPIVTVAPAEPAVVMPADTLSECPTVLPSEDELPRRELLAIKTNVLLDAAYMPGYNRWCPIPNVAVEYYPKGGHFTFGASFDMPWWQHYDKHKFFQLRNYQLETRYYLRPNKANGANRANRANRANEPNRPHKPYKAPAFSGFYLQAYAHAGIFGICFDADRGWVGEGAGAGLGLGYVVPLSRNGHWRLELGLQAGFFRCKYDPYQYENPVDPNYRDNLYYYKWKLDPSLFKKRQYRWNWIGPTRVGITLSYDLLYRRTSKRGISFINHEPIAVPVAPEAPEVPEAPAQERRAAHE